MTNSPRTQQNIERLFGWYRRRYANAAALRDLKPPDEGTATFAPEQHVLIGAGLDAMATDWADVFRPELSSEGASAANRLHEFLEQHAEHEAIFQKVAAPMLADWLVDHEEAIAAAVVRRIAGDVRNGIVRYASEDPDFLAFSTHPEFARIDMRPAPGKQKRRPIPVRRFRFGEVLYRDYRCGWVHNLRGSERLAPSDANEGVTWTDYDSRVRYQNISELRRKPGGNDSEWDFVPRRRPVFSIPWLLARYAQAIASFEVQCVREQRDPIPHLRRG